MARQIGVMCFGHTDSVVEISFSKDCGSGFYLASAGLDGQSVLRHGDTGNFICSQRKHEQGVWSVSLNEDAKILASGGGDSKARIWDAILGKQLFKYRHPDTVSSVHLNAEGSHLLTGCLGDEPSVRLYDVENSNKRPLLEFRGHHRGVRDVIFCVKEHCILSSSYDRTVRMWDCRTGKKTNSIVLPHHAKSIELNYTGDIVTISYGNGLIFLDPRNFVVLKHRKLPYKVSSATLNPSNDTYVCGNSEGYAYQYDFKTDVRRKDFFLSTQKSGVCCLRFSPDGEICAISNINGNIVLWRQNMKKKYGLFTSTRSSEDDQDEEYEFGEEYEFSS
ncbi:serine-threonine kinase receptor-associated protein [Drosophila eugracilis]|uniref:serine-threonine kinase receptor-associated protein n=1 Tax=Drosophila eugracilis TaxID=29029 RepID=UPI0007E7D879|nr:serine-threonine kinase receptor-associated protein [Drosophila eugracilis]